MSKGPPLAQELKEVKEIIKQWSQLIKQRIEEKVMNCPDNKFKKDIATALTSKISSF